MIAEPQMFVGRRALVVSGAGEYADPWHPFESTSEALAGILHDAGFAVECRTDVTEVLSSLDETVDLVVFNFGESPITAPPAAEAAVTGTTRYLGAGGSILAMHAAMAAFAGSTEWEDILGGRWVPGTTTHPEFGRARISLYSTAHPIACAVGDFDIDDERYARVRVSPDVVRLAYHEFEGTRHPLVWLRENGSSKLMYDALGHDHRSFESESHLRLIRQGIRWLVDTSPASAG